MLAAVTSDQLAVGTVSGLLIAFSAAVFKLYGKTQDEWKESAEDRVKQVEKELERTRKDAADDKTAWLEEKTQLQAALNLAQQELRDCWQRQLDQRMNDDH